MKIQELKTAIVEAERFLSRATALEQKCEDMSMRATPSELHIALRWALEGRDAAAVKRASLDLTMALADLRRRGGK